jgi:6-phosphogluconolactonase
MVAADGESLAMAAAAHLQVITERAQGQNGRASLALSGGRTPELTYGKLAASWQVMGCSTSLLQVDERLVAGTDINSNAAMLRRCWPDATSLHLMVPPSWPGKPGGRSVENLAAAYALRLRLEATCTRDGVPVLDAVVLGLGSDGHTASLFPGSQPAQERSRWVMPAAGPPAGSSPAVPRLTLTFPVLLAAKHLVILVTGAGKADVVATLLAGRGGNLPGARLLAHPAAVWFLDRAAAAGLSCPGD